MPSTNGSQITLLPFLRNLDGNSQTLEAEQVYYLTLGATMASSNKTAVYTVKHSILLVTGCITKEKYGLLTNGWLRGALLSSNRFDRQRLAYIRHVSSQDTPARSDRHRLSRQPHCGT